LDKEKKALLPFAIQKRAKGMMQVMHSSPGGTYGGFLGNKPFTKADLAQLLLYLKRWKNAYICGNPLMQMDVLAPIQRRGELTHLLSLNSSGVQLDQWSKNHRRSFKKGQGQVEVGIAEQEAEWRRYYELYELSLKRWGERASNHYIWSLFELIRALPSEERKLWVARVDGLIVAGCLCFYQSQHAVYWHGAADAAYFNARPMQVLFYHIIDQAAKAGFQWMDFNPSGGQEGVKRFKAGFGAEEQVFSVVERVNWLLQWANR